MAVRVPSKGGPRSIVAGLAPGFALASDTRMWMFPVLVLALLSSSVGAQKAGFIRFSFSVGGSDRKATIYVPPNYDPSKDWPLILFLHGAGERGDDNRKQAQVGIGKAIRRNPERFPCLVLMPQCPKESMWSQIPSYRKHPERHDHIDAALAHVLEHYSVDRGRIALTGLSMGGFGSFCYGAQNIDTFCAIAPICGGGKLEDAAALSQRPLRVFHGAADPTVPPRLSREMVEAIRDAGGDVRYTEYPGVRHNSWDRAYGTPELIRFLLEDRRPARPIPVVAESAPHALAAAEKELIRAAFQRGIEGGAIPGGGLLLIRKGEVVFREAFGVADMSTGRPFRIDSPCRIASVSKPHTATTFVILSEKGKLSLDVPISDYLPAFTKLRARGKGAVKRVPTLAEALSHTAGFASNKERTAGRFELDRTGSLADVVARLAGRELATEPGERYAYSGLGYMTAGRVAEVVTGKSFFEVMRETLLEPIGATETTFYPSKEQRARMALPYERSQGKLRLKSLPNEGLAINPGGNLVATLDGVGRLMLLHRNRGMVNGVRLVSAAALARMYERMPATLGAGYGLGINILKRRADGSASRIRHSGASGTLAWIDFDLDLIIVILTQVPQQQTSGWRAQLLESILKAVTG